MKKYISILELAAASTWSKIIATLLALTAADFIWFGFRMIKDFPDKSEYALGIYRIALIDILCGPVFPILFVAAAVALYFSLDGILEHKNVNPSYTIQRLMIPEKDFYLTLIGFYFMVYMMLFLVQILLFIAMGFIFKLIVGPENMGSQDILLIFELVDFPSRIFPIGYAGKIIGEITFILVFSCADVQRDMERRITGKGIKLNSRIFTAFAAILSMYIIFEKILGTGLFLLIVIIAFVLIVINIRSICRMPDRANEET